MLEVLVTNSDFIFLLIMVGSIAVRIIPILVFRIDRIDTFYHLTAARQIWKEKKIPQTLHAFLVKGTYSYPPILHLILTLFIDRKKTNFFVKIISPIFDVLVAVLLYYFVREIIGPEVALISSLLYAVTPINVIESLSLTPRSLGALFLTLYLFLASSSLSEFSLITLIFAILSVSVVLLSHKMATQSLVFVSIFTLIVYLFVNYHVSIFIASSLIFGILFSIAVSKGFYLKVLRGNIAMLSYHFKRGNYSGQKKFGNPVQILTRIPWLPLVPVALYVSNFSLRNDTDIFLLFWASFFIGITLLWRYGDNYRYLVYCIAPLSILYSQIILSLQENLTIIFLVVSLLVSILRLMIFFRKHTKIKLNAPDLRVCFDYLRKSDYTSIACTPAWLVYPAAFYTEKKILAAEASPEPWEKGVLYSQYAKDENQILEVIRNFKIDAILEDSEDPLGKELEANLKNSKTIKSSLSFSSGPFKVIQVQEVQ